MNLITTVPSLNSQRRPSCLYRISCLLAPCWLTTWAFSHMISLLSTVSLPPGGSYILPGASPAPVRRGQGLPPWAPLLLSAFPPGQSHAGGQEWGSWSSDPWHWVAHGTDSVVPGGGVCAYGEDMDLKLEPPVNKLLNSLEKQMNKCS